MQLRKNTKDARRQILRKSVKRKKFGRMYDRYVNDLTKCTCCGMWYDLHTVNHILAECPAIQEEPILQYKSKKLFRKRKGKLEWVDDDVVFNKLIRFNTSYPP